MSSEAELGRPLVFVKLGGSLITDKTRPETVRENVLRRLAEELTAGVERRGGGVVVGHGSGSFGHAVASRCGFGKDVAGPLEPAALSAVQDAAARLHRQVVTALIEAGASPFSLVAGSSFVAEGGKVEPDGCDLVDGVLEAGCLPVLFGDLVLDRASTASILSTEALFAAVILSLLRNGRKVERVVWLGETEGILDAAGACVRQIDPDEAGELMDVVGGSAGMDVTGGMRLRLETALELARRGVPSLVADGRVPDLLETALLGGSVPGTLVGSPSGTV